MMARLIWARPMSWARGHPQYRSNRWNSISLSTHR